MAKTSSLRLCACLLNISEARNKEIVEAIASSALPLSINNNTVRDSVSDRILHNVTVPKDERDFNLKIRSSVLNIFSDHDYNRSVITIASTAEFIGLSVVNACRTALELIDLRKHEGGHPRLGAVDLVPIHPLSGDLSLEECGTIAKYIAEEVTRFVPGSSAFLFGTADVPQRRGLVHRRKEVKWYQGKHGSSYTDLIQDVGAAPSPQYGIMGVGAIPYVTNCNVTISTTDINFGREIAISIRATTPGGLPGVQAMAFPHEGNVEVACNIEGIHVDGTGVNVSDYQKIGLINSFGTYYHVPSTVIEDRVREMANTRNINTVGTSIVGFIPEEASRLAQHVLLTGKEEFWKMQTKRLM